jgi:hypothetical protein
MSKRFRPYQIVLCSKLTLYSIKRLQMERERINCFKNVHGARTSNKIYWPIFKNLLISMEQKDCQIWNSLTRWLCLFFPPSPHDRKSLLTFTGIKRASLLVYRADTVNPNASEITGHISLQSIIIIDGALHSWPRKPHNLEVRNFHFTMENHKIHNYELSHIWILDLKLY